MLDSIHLNSPEIRQLSHLQVLLGEERHPPAQGHEEAGQEAAEADQGQAEAEEAAAAETGGEAPGGHRGGRGGGAGGAGGRGGGGGRGGRGGGVEEGQRRQRLKIRSSWRNYYRGCRG